MQVWDILEFGIVPSVSRLYFSLFLEYNNPAKRVKINLQDRGGSA